MVVAFVLLLSCSITTTRGEQQVPCYFIFGDSLADVGNNNNLNTKARANYPPYGVDFPGEVPTGRFSNGRNFVDRISELLGFDEYIPPFSTASGKQILKGVNYASGAAGIRPESGQHLGDRISMDQQLVNHLVTIPKMAWMVGPSVYKRLNKCLYTVNIGSNDYINNYFAPQYYHTSELFTPNEYADLLINDFARQLQTLYLVGARKVAVSGVGLIGCTLAEISIHGTNGSLCVDKINEAAQLFNNRLISLVDQLNTNLPGAQFTYISSASSDTGSLIVNAPCCEVREDYQCKEFSLPCLERNGYVFWDGFHPTELVNIVTAEGAYNSPDSNNVHPFDIKTLVSTDHALVAKPTSKRGVL